MAGARSAAASWWWGPTNRDRAIRVATANATLRLRPDEEAGVPLRLSLSGEQMAGKDLRGRRLVLFLRLHPIPPESLPAPAGDSTP